MGLGSAEFTFPSLHKEQAWKSGLIAVWILKNIYDQSIGVQRLGHFSASVVSAMFLSDKIFVVLIVWNLKIKILYYSLKYKNHCAQVK